MYLLEGGVPHALEKTFLDELGFWVEWVVSDALHPVLPTPPELEVAQVITEPTNKSETQKIRTKCLKMRQKNVP